jgi:hypothetical protein
MFRRIRGGNGRRGIWGCGRAVVEKAEVVMWLSWRVMRGDGNGGGRVVKNMMVVSRKSSRYVLTCEVLLPASTKAGVMDGQGRLTAAGSFNDAF